MEFVTVDAVNVDINYRPEVLLDALISRLQLKNDAQLSRILEVAPPVISKIRNKRLPIGASVLIRMHEASNVSITDLRHLMGDTRPKFGSIASLIPAED